MMIPSYLLYVLGLLLCGTASLQVSVSTDPKTKKPIIGVLMQKCGSEEMKNLGKYYIAASYVKYLESAGARVVPVRSDLTNEEYEKLFQSINGVLFPGGSADLSESGYARTAKIFYNLARQNFTKNEKLKQFFSVLTTNTEGKIEFISTVEGYKYPVYGVQWHPEKSPYEWEDFGISHAPSAVKAAFYLAEFFVSEARKNDHHFESDVEENKALIYQFHPVYTGNISSFQQSYMFN
ncbi:gamma-glutamyl hydrolase isoform 2-T2 [Rhynchonycteris naso]